MKPDDLMKQSPATICYYIDAFQKEYPGLSISFALRFAELCVKDFDTAMEHMNRIADHETSIESAKIIAGSEE